VPARAIWKASLEFGSIRLPVKLYAAVEDRQLHFRLLHSEDRIPVRQRMVDPATGEEVRAEEVRWGLQIEDRRVVLSEAELEQLQPKPSRRIEVTRFVPRAALDVAWFRRPYFLAPDGSARDCAALLEALRASDRYGIARFAMRGDHHVGALAWRDDQLQLVALHEAAEIVTSEAVERPAPPGTSRQERELAEQLIAMLDAPFDPAKLRDDYRERVEKLIAAKRRGRSFRVKEAIPRPARGELRDVLRRSLQAAKRSRRRRAA
jgi:DNA end-binding protein Ku